MNRRILLSVLSIGLLFGACANQTTEHAAAAAEVPQAGSASEVAVATADAEAKAKTRVALPLQRRLHDATLTEAVLDARGRTALTLDEHGGVRLWPDLHADAPSEPIALPIYEPATMSIAQTEQGFLVAFIDTAGGGTVGRVEVADGSARWIPLFERPTTNPLFELHVLAGGKRLLALGIDHRIHVLNDDGEILAELDQPGFVPWQLRVAQRPGKEPTILAVLAGPTRVQPLTLAKDQLTITGEARTVALDRGPNLNDLALTPDGTTVLALRRPQAGSKRFELEIINVASGERRIVAAESDEKKRPRVHPIDDTRVLLESGSGRGFYLDFDAGTPWPPAEGEADRETIPSTPLIGFEVPMSSESLRHHASVVEGVRIVPAARTLLVGRLDETTHRGLGSTVFGATAVALDATGERVAWAAPGATTLETVASRQSGTIPGIAGSPALLAFVGDESLVTVDDTGRAELRGVADGALIAESKVSVEWGLLASGWRPGAGPASGHVVVSSLKPSEPVHVLDVSATAFGSSGIVERSRQHEWPEAGKPRNAESSDWVSAIGMPYSELALRPGEVKLTEPDPSGKRIAFVQKVRHNEGFDAAFERWVEGPHDYVVTVYDRDKGTRLFTLAASAFHDLAWSGDGTRLAVATSNGGVVVDGQTGETVLRRGNLGLRVSSEAFGQRDPV